MRVQKTSERGRGSGIEAVLAYAGARRPSQQTTRTHAKSKLSLGKDGHAVACSAVQPADLIPEELPEAPGIQIRAIDAADQPSKAVTWVDSYE